MKSNFIFEEFWIWFQSHLAEFNALTNSSDPFWKAALNELKRIDSGLWFELSEAFESIRDFVITVEGDVKLFSLVENIIAQAPQIAG